MLTLFQKWIPVFISFCKSLNNIKNKFMRSKLWIIPAACIYCLLISAISIKVSPKPIECENQHKSGISFSHDTISSIKLNFFQRLFVKVFVKKYKKAYRLNSGGSSKADRQANTSLIFGISACAFLVLGLFVPYVILATIPASIVAMITGGAAIRQGTTTLGKAKTGKALGLGALIAFGVIIIAAAIIVASWFN